MRVTLYGNDFLHLRGEGCGWFYHTDIDKIVVTTKCERTFKIIEDDDGNVILDQSCNFGLIKEETERGEIGVGI